MKKVAIAVISIMPFAWAMLCGPASAHHSYSMFDRDKVITLTGLVKTWEMTNPHAFLWFYVKNGQKYDLWGVEAPGPGQLTRGGWNKSTVKPGDRVSVTLNPLKDGRHGGNMLTVMLPDGRQMQNGLPPAKGEELHD